MTPPGALSVEPRGDREIVMTRSFDAPRALVFDAFTKPELLKRWMYGPDGHTLAVCDVDLRPGGKLRCVWHLPSGSNCPGPAGGITEMGMSGEYREVVARGQRFLLASARQDGYLVGTRGGNMYGHALASIALCEAAIQQVS